MADLSSNSSPIDKFKKPNSFPRLFSFKNFSESTDSIISPTSILDTKPFTSPKNAFFPDPNPRVNNPDPDTRRTWDKRGVSLGIVDVLKDEDSGSNSPKPETRKVLFGSHLKIQIPLFPTESPKSPADFGIKTRNPQLGCSCSSSPVRKSMDNPNPNPGFTEMELSEDYTCVISYGPNPKTTHIFDDCVIDSGVVGFSNSRTEDSTEFEESSDSFLSFCYGCKKNLGHGLDIYMYRGEKAFCSRECRHQEMMLEETMNNENVCEI